MIDVLKTTGGGDFCHVNIFQYLGSFSICLKPSLIPESDNLLSCLRGVISCVFELVCFGFYDRSAGVKGWGGTRNPVFEIQSSLACILVKSNSLITVI